MLAVRFVAVLSLTLPHGIEALPMITSAGAVMCAMCLHNFQAAWSDATFWLLSIATVRYGLKANQTRLWHRLWTEAVPLMSICMVSCGNLDSSAKRPMPPASPATSKSDGISTRRLSAFIVPRTAAWDICTSASCSTSTKPVRCFRKHQLQSSTWTALSMCAKPIGDRSLTCSIAWLVRCRFAGYGAASTRWLESHSACSSYASVIYGLRQWHTMRRCVPQYTYACSLQQQGMTVMPAICAALAKCCRPSCKTVLGQSLIRCYMELATSWLAFMTPAACEPKAPLKAGLGEAGSASVDAKSTGFSTLPLELAAERLLAKAFLGGKGGLAASMQA